MVITDIRFAFIEIETLADPLASVAAPAIPFGFLLNQAAYQAALNDAIVLSGGQHHVPWHDDFGKLFWYYYLERKAGFYVTFNEAWRGLVPLQQAPFGTVAAPWLPDSEVDVRAHLYPWGVAAIIDVHVKGKWSIDKAVELGSQVRTSGKYDWTWAGKTSSLSMNGLMSVVLGTLRQQAYGATANAGQAGEMFSIVTVLDAEKADADAAVGDQTKMHRALDAFVSWSPVWKKTKLDKIDDRVIHIKQALAPAGHVLYGGRRGRAVWFPAGFPSSNEKASGSLHCYHQNLAASTLQTESLCALALSAAKRLAAGQTIGSQSVTYHNCTQLAAGILGRLHGGNADTYRSWSVRNQIQQGYLAEVNAIRKAFKQSTIEVP